MLLPSSVDPSRASCSPLVGPGLPAPGQPLSLAPPGLPAPSPPSLPVSCSSALPCPPPPLHVPAASCHPVLSHILPFTQALLRRPVPAFVVSASPRRSTSSLLLVLDPYRVSAPVSRPSRLGSIGLARFASVLLRVASAFFAAPPFPPLANTPPCVLFIATFSSHGLAPPIFCPPNIQLISQLATFAVLSLA